MTHLAYKPELLAPAGSMEALKAAIANGADAVYLGMKRFGARAYSSNFDEEAIAEAVAYAHLRGVKVYVTMNTIVFEDELSAIYEQIELLNELGVDGVIAQDLAVLTYVAQNFGGMEAHCSTQMGIDDVEGAALAKELGAKRVVVSREVPIEGVKEIRRRADIPVEIFVHGALCVSYSGNCIMSGMTGNRSGNRGRCIGSCRKLYDVVELDAHADDHAVSNAHSDNPAPASLVAGKNAGEDERLLGRNYILSTKDLNTVDHVAQFAGIDSLKIEGRMKEPVYVANVVSRYRMALDGRATEEDKDKLTRTFNRTYTKGYLFGEDRGGITNVDKPNHHGYRIGVIAGMRKGFYEIALDRELRQNDVIRIRHKGEDVNLALAKMYDFGGKLISGAGAGESCYIKLKEKLSKGDVVYKTKDVQYEKQLEARLEGEFRRFVLDMAVYAYPGAPLVVTGTCEGHQATHESDEILSEAFKQPTTKEAVAKQLARLNDTVFTLGEVEYEDNNAFVPAKMLNAARKDLVEQLSAQRVAGRPRHERVDKLAGAAAGEEVSAAAREEASSAACEESGACADALTFPKRKPYLTASVVTQEQFNACKECGINEVFFRNVVPRNGANYQVLDKRFELGGEDERPEGPNLLIGGMGGIMRYRGKLPFVTDYSLNVTNSVSCREMHRLGAKRVTLSYEINEWQLGELLEAYRAQNGGLPALEMIVYGHAPLLVTKYCPLKKMGQCGRCRTRQYEIRDEFGNFPILPLENCDTVVLNGKRLNLLDEMPDIDGVEAFRLAFTTESADEVRRVIALAQGKLDGSTDESVFDAETDTRGYFNKEIL